jgi:hypothetical protein
MHAKRSRQRKKQYLQAVEARFAYLEHINNILMENLQKHMPLRDIQRIISEEKNPQVVAVLQSAFSFTYPCPYPSARTPAGCSSGGCQCPVPQATDGVQTCQLLSRLDARRRGFAVRGRAAVEEAGSRGGERRVELWAVARRVVRAGRQCQCPGCHVGGFNDGPADGTGCRRRSERRAFGHHHCGLIESDKTKH